MYPGAGPAARTIGRGLARDGRGIGEQRERVEIALQRHAVADHCTRAPARSAVQSSPTHDAPMAAISSSHGARHPW